MTSVDMHHTPAEALPVQDQGCFFVGGAYVPTRDGPQIRGQMYVEYHTPAEDRGKPPIVLIHGKWQSGVNFVSTPDGRAGWATDFLRRGYPVYVVDQVGRGRSAAFPDYGGYGLRPYEFTENMFTGTAAFRLWPGSERHTQWPGDTGRIGDAAFDQFAASWIPSLTNPALAEEMNSAALIGLLERIGPAVLLTHSESGAYGWRVGDARPDLVRAIVATESGMVPFHDIQFIGGSEFYTLSDQMSRPWGLTHGPLSFEPHLTDANELRAVPHDAPEGPETVRGWVPTTKARLKNLSRLPIGIVTAEASYHRTFDYLTVEYFRRLGADVDHLELGRMGVHGNGHMLMLERNSEQICELLCRWIEERLSAG
ncbi:alpha/beta hydrolase [Devosia ginsengisoli]|uniref:alpha/beta hydrolase n=1 Tax=Devosia ginsengisoli TaxID=400770 RepID=UPI0026F1801A|nr:alpha/beta hydrolase [Devosia ginsengisoli]MCR6671288.1 alpha/beta hydrolase [Devosia ginsengisoli]